MASHLLTTDYTHLVMLDIDHQHPSNIVERLVQRVEEDPSRQIVAGLNFRRGEPYEPLVFMVGGENLYTISEWEPDTIIEVDAVATCSIIISREVFETVPGPPWFYYDYSVAHKEVYPTEDIVFCWLCGMHGIKIYVDTGLTSDHLNTGRINETVFRAYYKNHGSKHFEEVTHGRNQET